MNEKEYIQYRGFHNIYDEEGREQKTLEGNYTDVFYLYKNTPCACTGSSDGTVSILDLASFEEKISFQCPSANGTFRLDAVSLRKVGKKTFEVNLFPIRFLERDVRPCPAAC